MVDGVPPASIFLGFLWCGKIILAIIIVYRFFIYVNFFCVKYEPLGSSQCREIVEGSVEMMKKLVRKL